MIEAHIFAKEPFEQDVKWGRDRSFRVLGSQLGGPTLQEFNHEKWMQDVIHVPFGLEIG